MVKVTSKATGIGRDTIWVSDGVAESTNREQRQDILQLSYTIARLYLLVAASLQPKHQLYL